MKNKSKVFNSKAVREPSIENAYMIYIYRTFERITVMSSINTFIKVIALKHILSLLVGSYGMRGGMTTPLYALISPWDKRFSFRFPFTDGIALI